MSDRMKDFFKSIRESEDLLLFKRLYCDPEAVLGSTHDEKEAPKEYFEIFDFFRLILNNNLTKFIRIFVEDDIDFYGRTRNNPQIYRKLCFFLYDSIDYKRHLKLFQDKDLISVINNQMSIANYHKNHPERELWEILSAGDIYKKYEKLFQYGYPQSQIEEYDETEAKRTLRLLNDLMDGEVERLKREEEYNKNKREVFNRIAKEDCSENAGFETFLRSNPINNPDDFLENWAFYTNYASFLVCQNKFLDVIETKLRNKELGGFPLDNTIDIIYTGICVKKMKTPKANYYRSELLDPCVITEFNIRHAEHLYNRLIIYRNLKNLHGGCHLKIVK